MSNDLKNKGVELNEDKLAAVSGGRAYRKKYEAKKIELGKSSKKGSKRTY